MEDVYGADGEFKNVPRDIRQDPNAGNVASERTYRPPSLKSFALVDSDDARSSSSRKSGISADFYVDILKNSAEFDSNGHVSGLSNSSRFDALKETFENVVEVYAQRVQKDREGKDFRAIDFAANIKREITADNAMATLSAAAALIKDPTEFLSQFNPVEKVDTYEGKRFSAPKLGGFASKVKALGQKDKIDPKRHLKWLSETMKMQVSLYYGTSSSSVRAEADKIEKEVNRRILNLSEVGKDSPVGETVDLLNFEKRKKAPEFELEILDQIFLRTMTLSFPNKIKALQIDEKKHNALDDLEKWVRGTSGPILMSLCMRIFHKNNERNAQRLSDQIERRQISATWDRLGLQALFYGPPGSGKTSAAAKLGDVTGLPVAYINEENFDWKKYYIEDKNPKTGAKEWNRLKNQYRKDPGIVLRDFKTVLRDIVLRAGCLNPIVVADEADYLCKEPFISEKSFFDSSNCTLQSHDPSVPTADATILMPYHAINFIGTTNARPMGEAMMQRFTLVEIDYNDDSTQKETNQNIFSEYFSNQDMKDYADQVHERYGFENGVSLIDHAMSVVNLYDLPAKIQELAKEAGKNAEGNRNAKDVVGIIAPMLMKHPKDGVDTNRKDAGFEEETSAIIKKLLQAKIAPKAEIEDESSEESDSDISNRKTPKDDSRKFKRYSDNNGYYGAPPNARARSVLYASTTLRHDARLQSE